MIGLVFVSHSRALADALVALVKQVSLSPVPIAVAAGVGEERQEFGTDAVEISEAIQSVYSEAGVLVLMDLGSAVLSAGMALELLPPEIASHVRFCAGPLVEGAIAAGVQAGLGSDIDTVCSEAEQALLPKKEQIGPVEQKTEEPTLQAGTAALEGEKSVSLTLKNLHGLHARPAARFVQTAAAFNAKIEVKNLNTGKGPVSAKSLNALATLGAVRDQQILVTAQGAEAGKALEALSQLVEESFGEKEIAVPGQILNQPIKKQTPSAGAALQAVAISEGVAVGPLYRYRQPLPPIPDDPIEDPQPEWERLQRALEITQLSIRERRQQLTKTLGESETAIFDAHLLILQDPELLDAVRALIFEDHLNAAMAWHRSILAVTGAYENLPDPYLQQRAVDVRDVGTQLLFALIDKAEATSITLPGPVILLAQELTPTETSQLDMSLVLGLMTEGGGPTSHSAILARALGIPAISGTGNVLDGMPDGTTLGMNGSTGSLWIEPSFEIQAELSAQREAWLKQRQLLIQSSHSLAATRDGRRIEVAANVGQVLDAKMAIENGAEGVGLLRTEFLYLTRNTPPTEAEQVTSLRQIGEVMGDRPIVVRTLDVGGDKALPYLALPPEANPFLGVRALRMSLRNPELFITQLRAILRAGADFNLRVMFPMVANVDEVLQARQYLEQAHTSLTEEHLPHRWPIETGIMVEIPAAALLSPVLAEFVDFFSIGTNDLTQYTLAAERGNPALSALADAFHPAVLRLIGEVAAAAHAKGKWVGVCGELAGDPLATPVLVGLGVDELSLNPAGIPKIKAVLRELDYKTAQAIAQKVLEGKDAPSSRSIAERLVKVSE